MCHRNMHIGNDQSFDNDKSFGFLHKSTVTANQIGRRNMQVRVFPHKSFSGCERR